MTSITAEHPVLFVMENWEDENPKNIYVIGRKLATYAMLPGEEKWVMPIGNFELHINIRLDDIFKLTNSRPYNVAKRSVVRDCKITDFEKFNVDLFEYHSKDDLSSMDYIYLNQDSRFKNYQPIQYDVIETPTGGRLNQSDGKKIPLLHLMELIRLLHRLSNLTAFL